MYRSAPKQDARKHIAVIACQNKWRKEYAEEKNTNYPSWSVPKSEQLTYPKCINNHPQYFNYFSN